MLEHLKPIAGRHSINRSVASVFIPQVFLKPQDIFDKIKGVQGFSNYPKKVLMKATTININNNSLGVTNEQIRGFIFENYDDKGAIRNIFKLENLKENQSALSLENRNYSNWDSFLNQLNTDLDSFARTNDFYVNAVSLNYRDEFIWTDSNPIPVVKIFNIDSELLNKKFLTSKNGTFVLITQEDLGNGLSTEEKTEVSFNNDVKRIVLDHHYAMKFDDIKLFSVLKANGDFNDLYNKAHSENKQILKEILTSDCQKLINLT